MKRAVLLVIALLFTLSSLAQDVIVTKEGKKINAKVTEVNENDIRYKIYEEENSPLYFMKKSEISTILYESGRVEVFNLNTISPQSQVSISKAKNVNSDPYYLKAKKMRDAGIGCFAAGSTLWITGAGIWVGALSSYAYYPDYGYYRDRLDKIQLAGICIFSIGGATTISGIVMWAIGQKQMKIFNQNGYSLFENEKMQLNLAIGGNQVGVKLNF